MSNFAIRKFASSKYRPKFKSVCHFFQGAPPLPAPLMINIQGDSKNVRQHVFVITSSRLI